MTKQTRTPKLTSKRLLIEALHAAAELEQQFMCQYLYAVFSLKKDVDDECLASELEAVRRWASVLYMVARQEMEHLSIVNSLLTAIGGAPRFAHGKFPSTLGRQRREVPLRLVGRAAEAPPGAEPLAVPGPLEGAKPPDTAEPSDAVGPVSQVVVEPCPLPFVMEPFSLNTVRRFACMEAPDLDRISQPEKAWMERWCFRDAQGKCGCVQARSVPTPPPPRSPFDTDKIVLGSIEELYEEVRRGLKFLVERDGEETVFDGRRSGQSEIPSEYMITLFPIGDLRSALSGIDLITEQGEGIDAPPGFESHFMRFALMAREYEALQRQATARARTFRPAKPLLDNPKPADFEPGSLARQAVELFRRGYVTLLYMLTGYYQFYRPAKWSEYPYLSQALEQTSFAPMMTMFVRSLAEVIVELPVEKGFAGPCFDLTDAELARLRKPDDPRFNDLKFYHDALRELCDGVEGLQAALHERPNLQRKVTFMYQTMVRVANNLVEITEQGTFPKFNPKIA